MATMDNPKTTQSTPEKIRRSVRALKNLPFEGRLRLLVRAGLMSEAEAIEKVARRPARDSSIRPTTRPE